MWNERLTKKTETAKQKAVVYIVAADVKALYPNLYTFRASTKCRKIGKVG